MKEFNNFPIAELVLLQFKSYESFNESSKCEIMVSVKGTCNYNNYGSIIVGYSIWR